MEYPKEMSDEELVTLAVEQKEFFGALISRYEAPLTRYVRRLGVRNEDDIPDVLQEVFIKIYKNLNNFDQKLKFSSWAYRIAHNEAINHIKKQKTTIPIETDNEEEAQLINILESSTDIKAETIQKETASHIRLTLQKLPKKYQKVEIS